MPALASLRPCVADHSFTNRSSCANRKSTAASVLTTSALNREFALPTLTSHGMSVRSKIPISQCLFPGHQGRFIKFCRGFLKRSNKLASSFS